MPHHKAIRTYGSISRKRRRNLADDDEPSSLPPAKRRIAAHSRTLLPPSRPETPETPRTPRSSHVLRETPTCTRQAAADRSARRKTTRAVIERAARQIHDDDATDQDDDDENALAREIYSSSPSSSRGGGGGGGKQPATPVPSRPHARLPASAEPATITPRRRPPQPRSPVQVDLPAHERFFVDNKPGRPPTSDQTLADAGMALLTHEQYFAALPAPLTPAVDRHAASFPQWAFELDRGFGLCLYGFGCKRAVLCRFGRFLAEGRECPVPMLMVTPRASPRDILQAAWAALQPGQRAPVAGLQVAIGALIAKRRYSQPDRDPSTALVMLVESIDAPALRRAQATLVALAATPGVRLACIADTADFALLWDAGARASLGLVFHDCSTLLPSRTLDPVDDARELLGRRASRAPTRAAVRFVLRSLPDKARQLFRMLVAEALQAPPDADDGAVESRRLYNRAVHEFICGNEISFRTLLKEFHDHDMVVSRTDSIGTELLALPFPRAELEGIMEDLRIEDGQ